MSKKIVLAYSGGLGTTVIIPWLKENYDCDVIAVCCDVGQKCDWSTLEQRALDEGASRLIVKDLKEEFVRDYLWPIVKAGAVYEKSYLLGTSAVRPLLARCLARIALEEAADAVAHGYTGKGSEQLCFELGIRALLPSMEIIAPRSIWDMGSQEEELAYLKARGIPVPKKKEEAYSRDDNLWHVSHEGLDLEDPAVEPYWEGMLKLCSTPEKAPNVPEYVELAFERGVPTALNGVPMGGVELVTALNAAAGRHGVGIVDRVENRVSGVKGRGVYEAPAGTVILEAHEKLEQLCLDRKTLSFKQQAAQKFAELLYEGDCFSPLAEALRAFVDSTQSLVTGVVKLKLFKGGIISAGAAAASMKAGAETQCVAGGSGNPDFRYGTGRVAASMP